MENYKDKGLYRINAYVVNETADILKEIGVEYGCSIPVAITILCKAWKKEQKAIKGIDLASKMETEFKEALKQKLNENQLKLEN